MNITDQQNKPRPAIATDPLPQAGESLRKEINRLDENYLGPSAALLTTAICFCFFEWYRYFLHLPITLMSAIYSTLICIAIVAVSLVRLFALRRKFQNLYLGLRGEQHIGQYLHHECRPLGYHIFHDIQFDNFNIDHLLIGPGGIFVIETKNRSKPAEFARLTYDGQTLTTPDGFSDDAPLKQAAANTDAIKKLLKDLTGRTLPAATLRPVVLFPGWFIEGNSLRHPIWVLPDNNLHRILPTEHRRLSPEDIALFSSSLTTHLRHPQK